ncbi:MAG TPA: signal recognition particle protein [Chlamydiales bacterium]|nr:signal recognition particle protein [Chlamydiales bacterium]
MFGTLTEKLQTLFSSLSGKKILSEENIADAVRQVRLALLDADVNYTVVSTFISRVKAKAIGDAVIKSVTPSQQFVKIVHDELIALMGSDEAALDLNGKLSVIMVCGLQGSGKTTSCAKLAAFICKTEKRKKILLAACDLQRPAAIDQLRKLGSEIGIAVFSQEGEKDPVRVAKSAYEKAQSDHYDVLIVDTAGRLHIDEELMKELERVKSVLAPREVLFVASAATGQDAARTAAEFDKRVQCTGSILTMLDGSARAGAAISIREVTKKPLKFEGIGEKIDDLQIFNPRSMADRILGMGDVINLVKKAKEHIDEKESAELEQKIRKASFTYEDYLKQMRMVKKMGSFKSILKMMPGLGTLGDLDFSNKEFEKTEAIILSMTPRERQEKDALEFSRRKRVAKGSGVDIEDVNRLIKGFKRIKQLFKNMPDLKGLKTQLEGKKKWH